MVALSPNDDLAYPQVMEGANVAMLLNIFFDIHVHTNHRIRNKNLEMNESLVQIRQSYEGSAKNKDKIQFNFKLFSDLQTTTLSYLK
jgi:hypothetical protein